jgi:hypothetical protein
VIINAGFAAAFRYFPIYYRELTRSLIKFQSSVLLLNVETEGWRVPGRRRGVYNEKINKSGKEVTGSATTP